MTYGIGMAGSGFMGRTWSEVAQNHAPGTHLAGVAVGRRAPQLATDYGVPLFGSYEDMLASDEVSVVVLATPPAGHLEQTLAAAKKALQVCHQAVDQGSCEGLLDGPATRPVFRRFN